MIYLSKSKRWYSNLLYLFLAGAFCSPLWVYMVYRIIKEHNSKRYLDW